MTDQFSRTELLIGEQGVQKLQNSKVAIFGIGGVGSFVAEGLARAGVQKFILIDNDIIDVTNINRQIHATQKTIGKYKVDVMKERILEINPKAVVETSKKLFLKNEAQNIIDKSIDYIVDAVDTVTAKIELAVQAEKLEIPIISAMGTGNKLNPTEFEVDDIYNTRICPLAKVMRKELRARGVKKLKVVYSKEEPIKHLNEETSNEEAKNETINDKATNDEEVRKQTPGSISFVPSVVGLIISSEVVKDIIK